MLSTLKPINNELITEYTTLLVRNKIAESYKVFYIKWLRFYLDFCDKYRQLIGLSIIRLNKKSTKKLIFKQKLKLDQKKTLFEG